jgi:hypothetical protein
MMRHPLLSFGLTVAIATTVVAADEVMRAREVVWSKEAPALFDQRWRIPPKRVLAPDPPNEVDLLRVMKALATRRFPYQKGERRLPWTRSFPDLVRGLREARDDPARRVRMLRILREGRPSVWKAVGAYLPELVHDDLIRGNGWDPADDAPDDGLLLVETFDRNASGVLPWTDLDGTDDVYQAAAIVYADLEAMKESEANFTTYMNDVGVHYEFIHAVRGSYIRGQDERGSPRAALRISFRDDIQFPYGVLDCDVRMQSSLDADGHLVTDFYSTSEDVYWLAGQSVSIPLVATDGAWVAQLQVLVYGIDLRGVPDGDGSRQTIVRGNLGNFKRRAERLFTRSGSEPRTVMGDIPEFVVRGLGPAPASELESGDD